MSIYEVDPGVRAEVVLLRKHGFETTDSGDGVSKPKDWYESGHAMPFKHVAMSTDPAFMVSHAEKCAELLGPGWTVEASYDTTSKVALLLARERMEEER